ncbi:hypothetical protein PAF15_01375 [Weissella koreensis]|uniref:hypothetical protein n=1 Tax=Weissella koreensis TaxID=165096 RepID=UPI0022BA4AF5|nr:hypothetical protein [Weissella koreensis]MCZ9310628.1 hypothetical protein [Weissella koreensis]
MGALACIVGIILAAIGLIALLDYDTDIPEWLSIAMLIVGFITSISGMIMLTPTKATIKIRQDDGKISVYKNVDKDSIDTHNDILTFNGADGDDDSQSVVDVKNKKVYIATEE